MALMLVVTGWLYVAIMMAVAEANHPQGSVPGAIFTFFAYGVGPVALLAYLMTRSARRRVREARQARADAEEAAASGQPDGGGEAAADAVAPVRKEP